VDDAGSAFAPDPTEVVDMVQERIDQGTIRVTCGRMHDHARRLVDDDEVAVFVHDVNRQRLGRRPGILWGWNIDEDPFSGANGSIRSRRPSIEPY
jgi:hypothetical protein